MNDVIKFSDIAYEISKSYNFSMISAYESMDIKDFKKVWIDGNRDTTEKSYFVFGDALDTYLTNRNKFDDKYAVLMNIPSGKVKEVADEVCNNLYNNSNITEEDIISNILAARKKVEYYMNRTDESILEALKKDNIFNNYIATKAQEKKVVIDFTTFSKMQSLAVLLQTDKRTFDYFNEQPHTTIHYQTILEFEYRGVMFKCKPDIILVNHIDKTIKIADLKTTGKSIFKFIDSIKQYRYDVQAAIYTKAVIHNIEIPDYKFDYFEFIVVNEDDDRIQKYKFSNTLIYTAMEMAPQGKQPIMSIIKEIEEAKATNQWNYKKAYNDGILTLFIEDLYGMEESKT